MFSSGSLQNVHSVCSTSPPLLCQCYEGQAGSYFHSLQIRLWPHVAEQLAHSNSCCCDSELLDFIVNAASFHNLILVFQPLATFHHRCFIQTFTAILSDLLLILPHLLLLLLLLITFPCSSYSSSSLTSSSSFSTSSTASLYSCSCSSISYCSSSSSFTSTLCTSSLSSC